MDYKIGVQTKGLNIKIDGKSLDVTDKKSFIDLAKGSKIQVSKKMKDITDDLVVLKNGENLEILYHDGSSLTLEGFYLLENASIELQTVENEIQILSSNFESNNEISIVYTQGNSSFFNSLFKDNSSLINALNEYNHTIDTGLNAGDSTILHQSSVFSNISTTTYILGGVLIGAGAIALASGGGGGSSNNNSHPTGPVTVSGHLVDNFVSGVDYYINGSSVSSGKTGVDGSFTYKVGDTVTFKVAGITIGSNITVPSDGNVLLQDLVGVSRNEVTNPEVVKIAQFLQTLDSDGNTTNGITITAGTLTYLQNGVTGNIASLDINTDIFDNNIDIVTIDEAISHLNQTMIDGSYVANFDTIAPTATVALDVTALKVGETATLTVTFSEVPTNFVEADDLTVVNGTLSGGSFDVTGKIYTATFTPTDNLEDASNVVTLGTGWTDAAGNAPVATASSANYAIDTKEPTATIVAIGQDVTDIVGAVLSSTCPAVEGATIADAFDNNINTAFKTDTRDGDVTIDALSSVVVTTLGLTAQVARNWADNPSHVTIYGSNTSTTTNLVQIVSDYLDTSNVNSSTVTDYPDFTFSNSTAYRYYKIVFDEKVGESSLEQNTNWTAVAEVRLYTAANEVILMNTENATVQSSELGTAYLVKSTLTQPTTAAELLTLETNNDASVNHVAITAINTNTNLALTGLVDGSYNLYTVDTAGNLSLASSTAVTVDTTAPLAPTSLNLATLDDLGVSSTDNYTSKTTGLTIDGIGETGSLVQLYTWIDANTDTIIDDSELTILGSSVSVIGGTFSTDVNLAHSTTDYNIVAKQTDVAGNVSAASTVLTLAVNTTVPTATLGTSVHFYESSSVNTESYIEITGGSNLTSLVDTTHGVENVDGSLNYTDFKNQFDFSKMTWTSGASSITFDSADIEKVEIRLDSTLRIYLTSGGAGKWADMTTVNGSNLLNADNTPDSLTISDDFFSTVYGVTDSGSSDDMTASTILSSFTTTPDGSSPTIYSDTIILDGAGDFIGVNIQGSVTVIQSQGLSVAEEQTLFSIDAIDGSGYVENNNTVGLLTVDLSGSTIDSGGIMNVGGGNLHVDLYSGNITNLYTDGNMLIAFDENANGSSVMLDSGMQQLQVVSSSDTTVEFSGFTVSEDRINLWTGIFDAINDQDHILNSDEFYSAAGATSGASLTDRIIYNETDGSLYYDADGSDAGTAIKLMVLTDKPTLTAADFYVHTEVI